MIVTGDTNFYRKIVEGISTKDMWKVNAIVKELTKTEKKKGIRAMMGSIAASELLSHLQDNPKSRDYRSCLKACKVMYGHCEVSENSFNLLPSPQTQIAKEYFGKINQSAINTQQIIGGVMSQIAKKPIGETIKKFSNELSQIKNHIQSTEQCLINEVLGMCKQIDPSYTNWHLFVGDKNKRTAYLRFVGSQAFREQTAYAMLVAVKMQLTQQGLLPQTSIVTQNMVNTFISSYQVALSLREFFFSQFLNPGFDLSTKSRANFLWDEQILHFVGKQVDNEDIILLTSDTKMCDAAQNCGVGDKVMKYDEYVQELGVTPVFDAIKRGRLCYTWFRIKRAMNIV